MGRARLIWSVTQGGAREAGLPWAGILRTFGAVRPCSAKRAIERWTFEVER